LEKFRKHEFAARLALQFAHLEKEGHRFFDLLRWGKVAQRFHELERTDPNFKKYSNSAYLGFQENKNEWLPLPVDEVEGNPHITRNNPGW